MNKKFLVGNWKSNKEVDDIYEWFKFIAEKFSHSGAIYAENKVLVICPSFVHLPLVKDLISKYKLPINVGAQDVSSFEQGAYTGAVTAGQIVQYAKYVLIGHSERRKYFHEDEETLKEKVKQAKTHALSVIYCVPDESALIPSEIEIVAYEPVWAIGTGRTDTPENANRTAQTIKTKSNAKYVIYGGSVNTTNIKHFLDQDAIDGVLPGGTSLDPIKFWEMMVNAS